MNRADVDGYLWAEIGIGLLVSAITGVANGYASYSTGGEFWSAFAIGFVAGATGYIVGLLTQSPAALIATRSVLSFGSDLATAHANNGSITGEDIAISAVDAVMDGVFSCMIYYYNPFAGTSTAKKFLNNGFSAFWDGITDVSESLLFGNTPTQSTGGAYTPSHRSGSIAEAIAFG